MPRMLNVKEIQNHIALKCFLFVGLAPEHISAVSQAYVEMSHRGHNDCDHYVII